MTTECRWNVDVEFHLSCKEAALSAFRQATEPPEFALPWPFPQAVRYPAEDSGDCLNQMWLGKPNQESLLPLRIQIKNKCL